MNILLVRRIFRIHTFALKAFNIMSFLDIQRRATILLQRTERITTPQSAFATCTYLLSINVSSTKIYYAVKDLSGTKKKNQLLVDI